jgi:hypothetical protein
MVSIAFRHFEYYFALLTRKRHFTRDVHLSLSNVHYSYTRYLLSYYWDVKCRNIDMGWTCSQHENSEIRAKFGYEATIRGGEFCLLGYSAV